MAMATHIHLVRHGEVLNPQKLLYGRMPRFKLTNKGCEQAEKTALFLSQKNLGAIISSPLLRARQTARPIARHSPGLKVHISQWLNEVRSRYEGWPGEVLDARGGDIYSEAGPGSEQPEDILRRLDRFITGIRRQWPEKQVVGVTHGDVIAFGVIRALGADIIPKNKTQLQKIGYPAPYPAHASVTTIIYATTNPGDVPRVSYWQPKS